VLSFTQGKAVGRGDNKSSYKNCPSKNEFFV